MLGIALGVLAITCLLSLRATADAGRPPLEGRGAAQPTTSAAFPSAMNQNQVSFRVVTAAENVPPPPRFPPHPTAHTGLDGSALVLLYLGFGLFALGFLLVAVTATKRGPTIRKEHVNG
jgi:hypothetical protein